MASRSRQATKSSSNSSAYQDNTSAAPGARHQTGIHSAARSNGDHRPATISLQVNTAGVGLNSGICTNALCDTPDNASPVSSVSAESLNNHNENRTPPESSGQASLGSTPAVHIERLSLEQVRSPQPRPESKKISSPVTPSGTCVKRNAPLEPPISVENNDLSCADRGLDRSSTGEFDSPGIKRPRGNNVITNPKRPHGTSPRHMRGHSHGVNPPLGKPHPKAHMQAKFKDSGYETENVFQSQSAAAVSTLREASAQDQHVPRHRGKPVNSKYPDLILQPESSPISKDQLAAEVKGIYAGLVMVEAKCINIDAAQAADPDSELTADQWQALIALHRTLLYEHHDFLMATQHPSATPALRGLAAKYSMPARMWRHAIHSFLEVLRFRRPASQDYMLAFIYLAYQMVALLYETVPMFTDTWIECLGDLARYRMAIEENREQHAIWGGVAGRWYNTASDRHPEIGRLYHHLGILERPSVRKFFLYTKSLTCLVPFPNAKDSLATLCTPIVESANHYYTGDTSAEAGIVTFHALVYSNCDATRIMAAAAEALSRLGLLPSIKAREFGVELVISNAGAILELGSARNALWQRFGKAVKEDIQHSRPSAETSGPPNTILTDTEKQLMTLSTSQASSFVTGFVYSAFNTLIRTGKDRKTVCEMLPTVHAILLWFYSLHSLELRNDDNNDKDTDFQQTIPSLPEPATFSWSGLANYLNLLLQDEPIGARTLQFARQGMFLLPERSEDARPLNEDYTLRGLIWTPTFYPSGWFSTQPDDGGRAIENPATHKARYERVQWLALYLGFRIEHLKFDLEKRVFHAPGSIPADVPSQAVQQLQEEQKQESTKTTSGSRTSSTPSAHSDDDGHVVITKKRKSDKALRSLEGSFDVPPPSSKRSMNASSVQVVDTDNMQWEQCQ